MAENEVTVSIEEPMVGDDHDHDQFGKLGDGSDHMRALAELKSKLEKRETSPSLPSSKLQCTKVPERLKGGGDDHGCYAPKLISLGPYHHGEPHLAMGEKLKLNLAETYIQECVASVEEIYKSISDNISKLRGCYDAESTKKYKDDEFTVMMLVDGCALLYYILSVRLVYDHEHINIRYQDISVLHRDALLLENQLPYALLLNLMMVGRLKSANDLWKTMFQEFFDINDLFLPGIADNNESESKPYDHLLDLFRRNLLSEKRCGPSSSLWSETEISGLKAGMESFRDVKKLMASFRNVKELMATGIRIKPSPTRCLRDISFTSNGITPCLKLPPITIDNSTQTWVLNLIAYEMSSDVPHDFISYLSFLDSLVGHADDVKELQSAGVLQNNLGTHEQVVQLFKTVSSFNLEPNFNAYKDVRVQIRKHLKSNYNSILKLWMRQCLDTYFSSPWTIIAWVGVTLALFFTAIQTYFAVFHP